MRYGMTLPPFGAFANPHYLIEVAQAAEAAGWDGFFLWDTVIHDEHGYAIAEPWSALAAIAAAWTKAMPAEPPHLVSKPTQAA